MKKHYYHNNNHHHKVLSSDTHFSYQLIKAKIDKASIFSPKMTNNSLTSFITLNNKDFITERRTASTNESFMNKKGLESFMQKSLPKIRKSKKKEKQLDLFSFLPSTKHNMNTINTAPNNKAMLELIKHSHANSIIIIKPLVLINKSIQLRIKKALVRKKIEERKVITLPQMEHNLTSIIKANTIDHKNDNNNYSMIEPKSNTITIEAQDKLDAINLKVAFPNIIKDNYLFSDIYQSNLNYLKHSLRIKYIDS